MPRFIRPRLTYANVVSTLCLFVLLGGGAYAATSLPANSVGTKQLQDHAVTGVKVAKHTLTTRNVKAYSLRGDTDIKLGSVGGYTIRAGGVRTRELANGSVTAAKLDPRATQVTVNQVPYGPSSHDVACHPGYEAVGGGVGAGADDPSNGTVVTSRPAVYSGGVFRDTIAGSVPNAWHAILTPGSSGTVYVICMRGIA